jgi:hypothetical protein
MVIGELESPKLPYLNLILDQTREYLGNDAGNASDCSATCGVVT